MRRRLLRAAVFVLAIAGALAPLPPRAVERWYSRGVYVRIERVVASLSNLVPFSLFDVLCAAAVAALGLTIYRAIGALGWKRGAVRVAAAVLRAAAAIYVAFLAIWGLNYRRVPMLQKVRFDPARITSVSNAALGDWAVTELNADYARAHAAPISLGGLRDAFEGTLRALGGSFIVPGRPKPTLLGWYFHQAAITGMTDPFLLETLLAPDLLDVEKPFVIAHEWAHLAGYADESEANFIAYVACRHGDAAARYSAALMMIEYAKFPWIAKPPSAPGALAVGPRIDIFAIRHRYAHTSATLRLAAREGYDTYLKANRVQRGIESYDEVVQLILGTEFDANGNPRLR
jgi:hypothetical protein